uniref:transposase n=1 Tax=Rhizobium sp. PDO1-076 TaxID=1125979 RepID=UPI001FCB5E9B
MVLDHEAEHPSRWAAVSSIAAKIGCSPATLHEWVKKTEVDTGKRAGLPSDVAEKIKALERENRELRQANVSGCLKLRVFGAEDCTRLVLG